MNSKSFSIAFILMFFILSLIGQSSYVPLGHPAYDFVDRHSIKSNNLHDIHTSVKYYTREDIRNYLISLREDELDYKSQKKLEFLKKEFSTDTSTQVQKGLWNKFYKNPAHLFELNTKDFHLTIDAFFNLRLGQENEADELIFLNTRGLELYGSLDEKFYFYTSFYENQSNFFNYINPFIDKYKAIPGQGNYKDFQSSIVDAINGFDYSNAQAYLGYKLSKHVSMELGHNKHFIGNGIRSLLLSDFSQNYFYLKLNTRFWKLHYQSIFAELSSIAPRQTVNSTVLPRKYMATHYLSYKLNPRFEIGLFESVIFSRENHFEFQYLNPLILYRTAEHFLDSPDNVLLGLNGRLNLFNNLSLYGQLLLDELRVSEIFNSTGWWGNKYGLQAGLKYIDFAGLSHFDTQVEINRVRPFTYSHFRELEIFPAQSVSSYSHFNQALAHPLGSNFTELIIKLKYHPIKSFDITAQYIYSKVGRNNNANFGGDILTINTSRNADTGVSQHQGALSNIQIIRFDLSYMIFHDFYIDAQVLIRKDENVELGDINTTFFGTGIRYNINNTQIDY